MSNAGSPADAPDVQDNAPDNDDALANLTPAQFALRWRRRIRASEKYFERNYFPRCKKIVARYRDERDNELTSRASRFNMLWANVQTLGPAIYARKPKPEVGRRWHDRDALSRVASLVLERVVTFEADTGNFGPAMVQARDDYLLCGRGTHWYRYEPYIDSAVVSDPATGQPTTVESLSGECAAVDYVHWRDFLHSLAPTWEQVTWVARRVLMTKEQVVKRFGQQIADRLSYNYRLNTDTDTDNRKRLPNEEADCALIWEAWDKETKTALWLSPDIDEMPLDVRADPLKLDDFFPCQKPLYATMTNDRLDPVPDYTLYQDQAREIDTLTQRISLLQKALALRGAYDSSNPALAGLLSERPENFLVPVSNWAAFAEKGGLGGAISFIPVEEVGNILQSLIGQRNQLKQDIYEITGMSDIIRGTSAASETATAQQIKSNYAGLRISDRRDAVEEFARSGLRIMAQIICNHFEPDTLRHMSGFDQIAEVQQAVQTAAQQGQDPQAVANALFNQAVGLLRNDRMRTFHIDVETDSMIEADQQQEQQNRMQFLEAAGGFISQSLPVIQTVPQFAPLLGQMLLFGVRGFQVARELESAFEEALQALAGAQGAAATPGAAAPGHPAPGPTPDQQLKAVEMQQAAQSEQAKTNLAAQTAADKSATERINMALDKYKADKKFALEYDKLLLAYGLHPLQQQPIGAGPVAAAARPPAPAATVQ